MAELYGVWISVAVIVTLGVFGCTMARIWCTFCPRQRRWVTAPAPTPSSNRPVLQVAYPASKTTDSHISLKTREAYTPTVQITTQSNKAPVNSIPSEQNPAYGTHGAVTEGNKVPVNSIPSVQNAAYQGHVHGTYGWMDKAIQEPVYTECY